MKIRAEMVVCKIEPLTLLTKKESVLMWKIKCLAMFNAPPFLMKEKRKGYEVKK